MLFSAILSMLTGFISFFVLRPSSDSDKKKKRMDIYIEKWSAVFKSALMALVLFTISLVISKVIFQPMFNLQTYCKSEPDEVIELVSVSDGDKFVVTDEEFYYYCRAILDFYLNEETVIIEKTKPNDGEIGEIQVKEYDSSYAESLAGVMKIYRYKYSSWWGWFFFDNPRNGKMVFLIPKGTFGKGKIVAPDPAPVYIPIN